MNWSSGKDAAFALYKLLRQDQGKPDRLLTSVNSHYNRVSMHGLRVSMLELQAKAIGIGLQKIELPEQPSMEDYDQIMEEVVQGLKSEGYTSCGFGDIFLEDLRKYREDKLKTLQISPIFPLWKKNTTEIIEEFLDLGFKAIVICIKADLLDTSFLGRVIDRKFIEDLPEDVDPCGENGEFHTFCYDGPIFKAPVSFKLGDSVYKAYKNPDPEKAAEMGFWFLDLLPA